MASKIVKIGPSLGLKILEIGFKNVSEFGLHKFVKIGPCSGLQSS